MTNRTAFIVDNSVWSRLQTTPAVRSAFQAVVSEFRPTAIMHCPPVVAEIGFSARNGDDHTKLLTALAAFPDCPVAPTAADTLRLQDALWNSGLVRSVGAMDTLVAAYGMVNKATILHFDSDFAHVAAAVPSFRHRWLVPRGSI